MKIKYITLLLGVCLLSACQSSKKEEKAANNYNVDESVTNTTEHPKITELRRFISTCDTTDITSASALINKYKEIFSGQSIGLCDTAYTIYQAYIDRLDKMLNDSLQIDTTDYSPLFESGKPAKHLVTYKTRLNQNGFKLTNSMGLLYVEQDRGYVAKNLYPFLSPTMKMYLDEIKRENEQGFALDDQISIRPKQLVDRILWYDNFLKTNTAFLYLQNCKDYRKAYLTYLVTGYGKSKVTEDTGELIPYFSEAYRYLAKYPDSDSYVLLQPYIDALRQKQTQKAAEIQKTFIIKGFIYNLNESK